MHDFHNEQKTYTHQKFEHYDGQNQSLSDIEFCGCTFAHCNFSYAEFDNCTFDRCQFIDCNLSTIKPTNSLFEETLFQRCKMIGINWTSAQWPSIQLSTPIEFHKCQLNHSIFFGLVLPNINMEACQIHDVNFSEADFQSSSFIKSDFTGSTFMKTNLSKCDFTDATHYHIDIFNNNITQAKFSLPHATNLLRSLDIEVC